MSHLVFLIGFYSPIILLVWLVWTPCLAVIFWRSLGSGRIMMRLLLANAVVLSVFCGIWYWGYYMSERWMHIIDFGAPWSWLGVLFATSYFVSFLLLRRMPKVAARSLFGPAITAPGFLFWVGFCVVKFDPFW
jgi:hypothetical protein